MDRIEGREIPFYWIIKKEIDYLGNEIITKFDTSEIQKEIYRNFVSEAISINSINGSLKELRMERRVVYNYHGTIDDTLISLTEDYKLRVINNFIKILNKTYDPILHGKKDKKIEKFKFFINDYLKTNNTISWKKFINVLRDHFSLDEIIKLGIFFYNRR